MCVIILLADTEQKEEGIWAQVFTPLCLLTVYVRWLVASRAYCHNFPVMTDSTLKLWIWTNPSFLKLLPSSILSQQEKLFSCVKASRKLECDTNKTLMFIYLATWSHMFGNFLLCSQYYSRCEWHSHDRDIDKERTDRAGGKLQCISDSSSFRVLPIAGSPELSILTQLHRPSK